ncbi:MAG: LamG-like jellyroll fold domain-containing protein [Nanoarchaeota archaeon]
MEKKWLIVAILIIIGVVSIWQIGSMVGISITAPAEKIIDFNAESYSDNETFIFLQYDLTEDDNLGNVFYLNGSDFIRTKKANITEDDGFSVNILAKVEDSTNKNNLGLISSHSQNNETGFRVLYKNFDDEDRIYFEIGDVKDYAEIEKGFCLKKWCYYSLTYDSNNGKIKVYLNGNKIKELKTNSKVSVNKYVNIGKTIDINNEYFIGEIADAEVYKGVLSDKEIKLLSDKI